jgi:hypothetical protein
VHRDHNAGVVKEEDVQGKAHAEGVNAGAAWDQQTPACPPAIEEGEAQQAGAKSARDANPMTEHRGG